MLNYLFILGSSPILATRELETVIGKNALYTALTPEIVQVESSSLLNSQALMRTLGGTVKIAMMKGTSDRNSLIDTIVGILNLPKETKITFGISFYGDLSRLHPPSLNKQIKERLEKNGKKVRFLLPVENALSSVQIQKQKVQEIIIVEKNDIFLIGETLIVQDWQDWAKRDFERPVANPKAGMLPPKVARMMVNLGVGKLTKNPPVVLDPFCGVGTIAAEALFLGCKMVASDLSKNAVEATSKNLDWLAKTYQLHQSSFKVLQENATKITQSQELESVDAIVTEPFLGPPIEEKNNILIARGKKITPETIKNILIGLEKLYKGSLKNWRSILKEKGKVVIIFPSFTLEGRKYPIKNIIDTCEKLGYNCVAGPFEYHRPQAIVKRNIYILENGGK